MRPLPAVHLSVSIARSPAEVYAFAADPRNLPRWAHGLGGSVEQVGDEWTVDSAIGRLKIGFAPRNELGVLDHEVTLPSGGTVYVPLRVVKNGEGSEVVLTLFRQPEMTDEAFTADAAAVGSDLAALKALMEREVREPRS